MTDTRRKPAAFKLDDVDVVVAETRSEADTRDADLAVVVAEFDEAQPAPRPNLSRRGWRWGTVFFTALGGLISLAVGLAIDQLIADLFSRADWLGWVGIGLVALVVLALLALVLREVFGLMRMRRIDRLRDEAEAATQTNDKTEATALLDKIAALYKDRADTARGRALIDERRGDIIDGRDLIVLAERDLMRPLDAEARRMVTSSSKRVSVVTAVSPRALVDVAFVLAESLRLIRRISTLYGGRPGGIGFWSLTRHVISHLAVTGSIAIGDSLIQELIGRGLAAKLSARLGEGVVNGLLTARIGIAAIDVCRPLPFIGETRPKISDVFGELIKSSGGDDKDAEAPRKKTIGDG